MQIYAGANIGELTEEHGASLLHIAVQARQLEVMEILVHSGLDVDTSMDDGATPLLNATMANWVEGMELLKDLKANIYWTNPDGATLIHLAAQEGISDAILVLADWKVDVNAKADDGSTALYMASQHGHQDIVNILLKCAACQSGTSPYGTGPMVREEWVDGELVARAEAVVRAKAIAESASSSTTGIMPLRRWTKVDYRHGVDPPRGQSVHGPNLLNTAVGALRTPHVFEGNSGQFCVIAKGSDHEYVVHGS